MEKRPRRQVYPLLRYLENIKNEDIRSDQDVQRLSGQWDNNMVNELLVTVLTDDYIPPIILGEENINGASQLWIIEGLQRSTSLMKFRYANYKITSSVEQYLIPYQTKKHNEDGTIAKDENGNFIFELKEFDIRNKTYDKLPNELQKKFDDYQLEVVIHEECSIEKMSKLVRRYNNHKPMNTSQKAFTYIDKFARDIREIINDTKFFQDYGKYSVSEMKNGTIERVITESVMAMFYPENWKKQSKKIDIFLNKNASSKEFLILKEEINQLKEILDDETGILFTSKNSFLWLATFHKFNEFKLNDNSKFKDFLRAFIDGLHSKKVNGNTFDMLDKNKATKDKNIVMAKLNTLEKLMIDYLEIKSVKKAEENVDIKKFVKEFVAENCKDEDIEWYEKDILNDLTLNVDNKSKLLEEANRPSLVAIIAYAFENDIDLDEWFVDYFKRQNTYKKNQVDNYLYMKQDLEGFEKESELTNVVDVITNERERDG